MFRQPMTHLALGQVVITVVFAHQVQGWSKACLEKIQYLPREIPKFCCLQPLPTLGET